MDQRTLMDFNAIAYMADHYGDFTPEVNAKIIRWSEGQDVFYTREGKNFLRRLYAINKGQALEEDCVICGRRARNGVVCGRCIDQYIEIDEDNADYEPQPQRQNVSRQQQQYTQVPRGNASQSSQRGGVKQTKDGGKKAPKEALAIVALVLGILALILPKIIGGLVGIAGFIVSIISLVKKKNPMGFAIAGIVLSLIGILMIGASDSDSSDKKDSKEPVSVVENTTNDSSQSEEIQEPAQEEIPDVNYTTVSVSQMMEELNSNAMKAQQTYEKQFVEITGRLNNVDASGKYISLVSSDDEFAIIGVQCYMKNDEQKAKVMNMNIGDEVTLRGKCTTVGEVFGYSLDIDSIDGYNASSAGETTSSGPITCSVKDMIKDLEGNAMKAQGKYKGQEIHVTGKLSNIDASGNYINIDAVEEDVFSFVNVQCFIKSEDVKNTVMELSTGDIITVNGTVSDVGELLGYSIQIESITK